MSNYRQIHTQIWSDSWFFKLSPDEKLVFVYLFGNERACLAGLYEIPVEIIAIETGVDVGKVQAILAKFENDGKAFYDEGWVWVPNLLRYNAENITSPKIQAHLHKWAQGVAAGVVLMNRWLMNYNGMVEEAYHIDRVSIPILQEQEQDQEPEHIPKGAQAPEILPVNLNAWLDFIKSGEGQKGGMCAKLARMVCAMYPDYTPEYGRIGKAAKRVGGYARMAHLIWLSQGYRVTGDPIDYCEGIHRRTPDNGGGTHKSASEQWLEMRKEAGLG